ncbi:hypothetical protein EIK77_008965 [Talaromyces pinophilus]|nr:hypothetical protein EIK77_008965 [Talaromyces pinophilus]
MPPRTRSAARAENALNSADTTGTPPTGSTVSRKRKATTRRGKPQDESELPSQPSSPPRKIKRQRTAVATSSSTAPAPPTTAPRSRQRSRNRPAIPSSHPSDENSRARASSSNSRRKSGRSGKSTRRDKDALPTGTENHTSQSPQRRPKKRSPKHSPDVPMKDADSQASEADPSKDDDDDQSSQQSESNEDNHTAGLMDDDDGDPFRNALFGHRTPLGLQHTLRALTGMMTSMSSRLREILGQLRMKEDPSIQLIALQELSDLLLVSNEDNLSGQFSPDSFVKELVKLMQPSETGEENPEIMLLACRCLANMMEALRGSVTNVVYGGAVPVLCQKLLDIQFIDLAEQALSVR